MNTIHYSQSTVFNVKAQTIVNTINCQGFMGAGLALEFKLRFPEMYEDYVMRCRKQQVRLGEPYLYRDYAEVWILNFPTKHSWKYPSQLQWIDRGLKYFVDHFQQENIQSIAFPRLGTSHGGLDWKQVEPVMIKHLQTTSFPVCICLDADENAQGREADMVKCMNAMTFDDLAKNVKIKSNIVNIIEDHRPLRRFHHLKKIKGLGNTSYEKLFKYCYEQTKTESRQV